jgi:3-phytase
MRALLVPALLTAVLACDAEGAAHISTPVHATRETTPVGGDGDAADDPCIWLHPTRLEESVIIGTDKREEEGGLHVYGLDGEMLQFLPDGEMNNVDLRHGFVLGGESVALVAAGNRSNNELAIYRVDPESRTLIDVGGPDLSPGIMMYGSCLYRSQASGELYAFANSKSGKTVQLRLFDDGGAVSIEEVRSFDAGGQVEGCVADDELGVLYLGEESVGIWKYGAEPDAGDERTLVDGAGDGHLVADVEGLALYSGSGGDGYLLASSQGNSTFVAYERGGDNAHALTFSISASDEIDEVSDTDGIEVTGAALGDAWPSGLFVAQDGEDDRGNQNFKLVPWEQIAAAADPPLLIDTGFDPRAR